MTLKPHLPKKDMPDDAIERDMYFDFLDEAIDKIRDYMREYEPKIYFTTCLLEYSSIDNMWGIHFKRLRSAE